MLSPVHSPQTVSLPARVWTSVQPRQVAAQYLSVWACFSRTQFIVPRLRSHIFLLALCMLMPSRVLSLMAHWGGSFGEVRLFGKAAETVDTCADRSLSPSKMSSAQEHLNRSLPVWLAVHYELPRFFISQWSDDFDSWSLSWLECGRTWPPPSTASSSLHQTPIAP